MTPTYEDGDVVIARMGTADFYDGAACIVSWRDHGFPIKGWCLKRVTRIGDDMFFITVDNPAFVPSLLSTEVVHIVAVVLDGVKPEQVLDQLAVSHVFDGEGRIVPALLAVALLSEG